MQPSRSDAINCASGTHPRSASDGNAYVVVFDDADSFDNHIEALRRLIESKPGSSNDIYELVNEPSLRYYGGHFDEDIVEFIIHAEGFSYIQPDEYTQ